MAVEDIQRHRFCKDDRLLLDANIWLLVNGPIATRNRYTGIYSAALRDMRINKSQIFLDVLLLSEFINSFGRTEWKQLADDIRPENYKDFRDGPLFRSIAEEITINAKSILDIAKCCDSGFNSDLAKILLNEFEAGNSDFNDLILSELCKNNGWTLVTHDRDFKTAEIDVLTANTRLLRDN